MDKGVAPGEALIRSNKATYGYKWTIFGVQVVLYIANSIATMILGMIPFLGLLLVIITMVIYVVAQLGCSAVIYRDLTAEESAQPAEATEQPAE